MVADAARLGVGYCTYDGRWLRPWLRPSGELEKVHVAKAQPQDVDRAEGRADVRAPAVRQAGPGEGDEHDECVLYFTLTEHVLHVHAVCLYIAVSTHARLYLFIWSTTEYRLG